MLGSLTAKAGVAIKANVDKVWDALTNPNLIRRYPFGTEAVTEWKVGSSITYKGVWQGKRYEDKGTILELVPNRLLKSTYWSSLSGLEGDRVCDSEGAHRNTEVQIMVCWIAPDISRT